MSGLQIEEGKWYRRRDGEVVGPAWRRATGRLYPWCLGKLVSNVTIYRDNGRYHLGNECEMDLVEEVPAPLPQHPVDVAIASEIDAETATSTFGSEQIVTAAECADGVEVKTWPYRVLPTGKDGYEVKEVGDHSLEAMAAARVFGALDGSYADTESTHDPVRSGLFVPDQKMADPRRAVDIAGKAASLVGGDRDRQHGAKHDNFRRIAGVWNAWLSIRKEPSAPLDAHDVGCMMALMKLARTQSGALNVDDYVDACGYAACAGEVAQISEP